MTQSETNTGSFYRNSSSNVSRAYLFTTICAYKIYIFMPEIHGCIVYVRQCGSVCGMSFRFLMLAQQEKLFFLFLRLLPSLCAPYTSVLAVSVRNVAFQFSPSHSNMCAHRIQEHSMIVLFTFPYICNEYHYAVAPSCSHPMEHVQWIYIVFAFRSRVCAIYRTHTSETRCRAKPTQTPAARLLSVCTNIEFLVRSLLI